MTIAVFYTSHYPELMLVGIITQIIHNHYSDWQTNYTPVLAYKYFHTVYKKKRHCMYIKFVSYTFLEI